eukprot:SAG25_NODE_2826_length_1368_cov_2.365642_1_plen_177_part_10
MLRLLLLNRFAQINFSAVADGVCTKRPIRLELRPLSDSNRVKFGAKQLSAMCTLSDYRDGHDPKHASRYMREPAEVLPFEIRTAHARDDELPLRLEIEKRCSFPVRNIYGTQHQYLKEELVLRVEAENLIHFDLVDLPGVDNQSQMTTWFLQKYVNVQTMSKTVMLLFQSADRGDTN